MPNKLEPRFVEMKIKEAGFQMLSPYIRSDKKLELLCPNGHRADKTYNNFKLGQRCNQCFLDSKKLLFKTHLQGIPCRSKGKKENKLSTNEIEKVNCQKCLRLYSRSPSP